MAPWLHTVRHPHDDAILMPYNIHSEMSTFYTKHDSYADSIYDDISRRLFIKVNVTRVSWSQLNRPQLRLEIVFIFKFFMHSWVTKFGINFIPMMHTTLTQLPIGIISCNHSILCNDHFYRNWIGESSIKLWPISSYPQLSQFHNFYQCSNIEDANDSFAQFIIHLYYAGIYPSMILYLSHNFHFLFLPSM